MNLNNDHILQAAMEADRSRAALLQIRVDAAKHLLAPLVAIEYQRAINQAISEAYPSGVPFSESFDWGKVRVQFNFSMPIEVAVTTADAMIQRATNGGR